MYKTFDSIKKLYNAMIEDKHSNGVNSSILDRYPLRFVLFEKFTDLFSFVQECSLYKAKIMTISKWMNVELPDQMITYSDVAIWFEKYLKNIPACDFVIAPFSEVARFLDDQEFMALIKTVRLIEPPEVSQQKHQRIYVPIIGMQRKMVFFKEDPNIHIWEYSSESEGGNYKLIISNGETYKVAGLDKEYTVCENFNKWLSLWENPKKVRKRIICTSKSIYACVEYAQPDNAFDFVICNNAYEFLTCGLELDFGKVPFVEKELKFWEELASQINVTSFSFDDVAKKLLKVYTLENETDFVKAWYENKDEFKRWLLKKYFLFTSGDSTYLKIVLESFESSSDSDFLSALATKIFNIPHNGLFLNQRLSAVCEAQKYGAQITYQAEQKIVRYLEEMAKSPDGGYHQAMKYITPLTLSERALLVRWLGEDNITREDVKKLFPELFHYTAPLILQLEADNQWVKEYIDEYRKSKISNNITPRLIEILKEKNGSPIKFSQWNNNFKTVKTCLYNRTDIDIYYWIDGLGIDWIPYLKFILEENSINGIYLNEILVAKAELPTITEVNKVRLEELSIDKLQKVGDLDEAAHTHKKYPKHILDEFEMLRSTINSVLNKYNGSKIAFVSDHGISYLAALSESPLNLGGYTAKHSGRYAVCKNENAKQDSNYIVLDDKITICSLTHRSLSTKTDIGTGAHGGATPEEVLVPIIIVSNQKNPSRYSARLIRDVISANYPYVKYEIKGLLGVDNPKVIYNEVVYDMELEENGIYISKALALVGTSTKVKLVIGDFNQTDPIIVETGVEEEDLFGDF